MIKTKPWGLVTASGLTPKTETTENTVYRRGYCSIHYHNTKDNLFWVHKGTLIVRWWPDGVKHLPHLACERVLNANDTIVMSVGIVHQFEAVSDVEMTEVYRASEEEGYIRPGEHDIHRHSENGMKHE